jgi:hypothetical protein
LFVSPFLYIDRARNSTAKREEIKQSKRERDMEVCCGRGRGKISTVEKKRDRAFF